VLRALKRDKDVKRTKSKEKNMCVWKRKKEERMKEKNKKKKERGMAIKI
jgi:hypothetical protein